LITDSPDSHSKQLPVLSQKIILVEALGYVAITEWVELLGQAVHLCETAGSGVAAIQRGIPFPLKKRDQCILLRRVVGNIEHD